MTVTAIYLISGLLIIVAVIVFLVVMRVIRHNQERVTALKQLAQSMDFTFYEKGDGAIQGSFDGFDLFSRGHSKKFTHVMTGRFHNLPVSIFEYQYITGGGKNSHQYKQTVIALESDKLHLPKFLLRPENLWDKIGSAFGRKDINLDAYPQFSKEYFLRGSSEELVRKLFSGQMVKYFEDHAGLCMEGDGTRLIHYRNSTVVPAEQIQARMQEVYDLYTYFKTF